MNDNPLSIVDILESKYHGIPNCELCHKANQLLGFLQQNLRGFSKAFKEHSDKQN